MNLAQLKSPAPVLSLTNDRAAIARRLDLGLGAEVSLCAGSVVVRHSQQVIDPVTAPGMIAFDQALPIAFVTACAPCRSRRGLRHSRLRVRLLAR